MIETNAEFEQYTGKAAATTALEPTAVQEPVPITQVNTQSIQAEQAAAVATFDAEQATRAITTSEAASAAFRSTDTVSLVNLAKDVMTKGYTPVQAFDAAQFINELPVVLSVDDREFLAKSQSPDEAWDKLEKIQRIRDLQRTAGASPVLSTVIAFADPLYLVGSTLTLGAAQALKAGRIVTSVAAATEAAATSAVVKEARPMSDNELIFNSLIAGAATGLLYRGGKVVREELPPEIAEAAAEGARRSDPSVPLEEATVLRKEDLKRPMAEWSLMKTFSSYSPESAAFAKQFLADPLNPGSISAANIHRELDTRLAAPYIQYEQMVKEHVGAGFRGYMRRMVNPKEAQARQHEFESSVRFEMDMRNENPKYRGADPAVAKAADKLHEYGQAVAKEWERKGAVDPGFAEMNPNYYTHRMSLEKLNKITDAAGGQKAVVTALASSIVRKSAMQPETAKVVAYAMVERARRKGLGIDNAGVRMDDLAREEFETLIKGGGFSEDAVNQALAMLGRKAPDAGKAPTLKSRIPLSMFDDIGNSGYKVRDLFDDNLLTLSTSYHNRTVGRMAAWDMGVREAKDWVKWREKIAYSISDSGKRRNALEEFDNIEKYFSGAATGEAIPNAMRMINAMNTATGLAASGLWQVVEYGRLMQQYGAISTTRAMLKSIPESRALWKAIKNGDKQTAWDIEEVLTASVANDIRIRPLVQQFEDMFSAEKGPWMQRAELAKDGAMFVNGQKYIHFHQSRTMAALAVQNLRKAAMGDANAAKRFALHGGTPELMQAIRKEIDKHGTKPELWDDAVFTRTRSVLLSAMDDAVVRARLGELPAWAEFSQLGKFLFKFRTFVLAAHNKTTVGTLHNEGVVAMAQLLMYQMPLAMLATSANMAIRGEDIGTVEEVAKRSVTYLSAIGLASEVTGVLFGNSRSFGTPGMLFVDKLYGTAAAAAKGDTNAAAAGLISAIPLVSLTAPARLAATTLRED